jgi:hypothetical protein
MPAARSATARRLGCDSTQLGEGGLVADPVGVVARRDLELPGELHSHAEQADELRGRVLHEGFDLAIECFHLLDADEGVDLVERVADRARQPARCERLPASLRSLTGAGGRGAAGGPQPVLSKSSTYRQATLSNDQH